MVEDEELVEVYRALNPPQAHIVTLALEDEGIEAFTAEEATNVAFPGVWPLQTRVLVRKSKVSQALEILQHYEKR